MRRQPTEWAQIEAREANSQQQQHGRRQKSNSKRQKKQIATSWKKNTQRYKCGGTFPHQGGPCPALRVKCLTCQKIGRYSKMCWHKDKDVKAVDGHDTQSEDDYYTAPCITIGHVTQHKYAMINFKDVGFPCIIDTGAGVNMMSETTYIWLGKPDLSPPRNTLFPYGPEDRRNPLPVIGRVKAQFSCNKKRRPSSQSSMSWKDRLRICWMSPVQLPWV